MPELSEIWQVAEAARDAREESRAAHRRAVFDLQRLREATEEARRSASRDEEAGRRLGELERERPILEEAVVERARDLASAKDIARDRVSGLLVASPQGLIEGLNDSIPILLLPVRLETRFGEQNGAPVLRLRIFPDDAAIAHHEKALTPAEVDAGQAYWRERCRANAEPDPRGREAKARGAWNVLAARHGSYRATWIARATQPTNWSDQLADPSAALFPSVETKPIAWSEAPRCFVLPDRFVVRLYAGGRSREVEGALIPDDLEVGPDPLRADETFSRDESTGRLKLGDEIRWLIDFDEAVKVGMGLLIPLELPREANGFDRIVVLGIRFSSGPHTNAALVARLIEAQRFSRGIGLAPQGTPTNNTDAARSGLTTAAESIDETFALEVDPGSLTAQPDHFLKSDGQRLAEGLGIPLDVVRALPAARGTDAAEALAMNRALWSATVGNYLREMLVPVMGDTTIERLRRFFGAYVTGRGLLPALRVGSQPYGVLATSALSLWEWSQEETGDESAFWSALLTRLRSLESVWRDLAAQVSYVGKPGDPFQHLLSIVGLQAASVEFYARKAISRDYLANYTRFRGTPQAYATDMWEQMQAAVSTNLQAIGLDPDLPFRLRDLVFWREHDLLSGPVIDDDPRVPFSETDSIREFDGTSNYIDWLRSASSSDIRQQVFRDGAGRPVPPPAALLYRMLRDSFLAELGRGGRDLVKTFAPEVFAELQAEPAIVNVGEAPTFTTEDVLGVDASKIGASPSRVAVGDHLVAIARDVASGARPPPEAAGLADLHTALGMLAPLPTARLERLFAEHVDLCSYRLDAWVQGLFARRLWGLRQRTENEPVLHLGAWGWLDGVRPSPGRWRVVSEEELPAALRSAADGVVVEDQQNGGFVHAPSLTHAVTAAVLRNAYLSHAEPERAEVMQVNLSSRRVRTALRYLEGVRNGQELAALLGYQLERGLHENHPGVELDQFIYVLRERFPFTSRKLTDVPPGTPAEAMEARNVINGYDLLDFVRGRAYPYGIAGLPAEGSGSTAASRAQAAAIREEIDSLAGAMDAIADLMLAESVHQVVQGNYDRAKGVLQAITEGASPPDPEVIETPRSGRSLSFRVALPLDPAQATGWNATLTPRARTNAALNHWLVTVLPAASDIQWRVVEGTNPPVFVSLDSLQLEPLDCVLMTGERLGDFSGEFERYLVHDYRVRQGVPDDVVTYFFAKPDPSVPDQRALIIDPEGAQTGKISLASVFPLLKALRRLVSRSRPLNARDLELPIEAQEVEPANPKGFDDGLPPLKDVAELKQRVEQAHSALTARAGDLDDVLTSTIKPLYDALQADPTHTIVPQWGPALGMLRQRMLTVCRFGVPEALPTAGIDVTVQTIDAIVAQAGAVAEVVARRLQAGREALDTTFPDPLPSDPVEAARVRAHRTETLVQKYTEAAQSMLGGGFIVLPLFRVHASARPELSSALATPISSDALAIEEWLQSLVRVRAPLDALGIVTTYQDWLGASALRLIPLQLPVRPGDPWIASAYGDSLGPGDVVSVVLCQPLSQITQPLCGLVLDEWTELVPTTEETTGVAFHFNRPNATAPQVLLLAVAPRLRGAWSWEDLMTVVVETFERAKIRAVEPDMIARTAYFQALPAILSEFSSLGLRSVLLAQKAPSVFAAKVEPT
ncbi:MAG TPA: hypothetical protein VGL18_13055 [Actinomycetota bacterium]